MIFGEVSVDLAEGGILAHSLRYDGGVLKKGTVLGRADIAALNAAGVEKLTIARLEPDDLAENEAAAALSEALLPESGLRANAAGAGRVNLYAKHTGVVVLDIAAIEAINRIDPAVSLATLANLARADEGAMIATIKIIPYAVSQKHIAAACSLAGGAMKIAPVVRKTADLILTRSGSQDDKLLDKGAASVTERLSGLGINCASTVVVDHDAAELSMALAGAKSDMVLLLTASATSDLRDTGPEALAGAGGRLERFGIPVDPGNLLFLGEIDGRPVIGLPGCVRSPALNGADWVLERIACGLPLTSADMAAMAVGGLLKEIPSRPRPRERG